MVEMINHICSEPLLHLPKINRAVVVKARLGIGNVEVVLEICGLSKGIEDCDALAIPLDPAPKAPVPDFDGCYRRRFRALCIDQELLVEAAFIVLTRYCEEGLPLGRMTRDLFADVCV